MTNSRLITLNQSESSMCPRDNAVIISVADWLPELPPLLMISGMNGTSQ